MQVTLKFISCVFRRKKASLQSQYLCMWTCMGLFSAKKLNKYIQACVYMFALRKREGELCIHLHVTLRDKLAQGKLWRTQTHAYSYNSLFEHSLRCAFFKACNKVQSLYHCYCYCLKPQIFLYLHRLHEIRSGYVVLYSLSPPPYAVKRQQLNHLKSKSLLLLIILVLLQNQWGQMI